MNEQDILNVWHAKLSELNCGRGGYVSAGEVAKYTHRSRNTAKKYMQILVAEGRAVWTYVASRSGSMATVYHVAEGNFA